MIYGYARVSTDGQSVGAQVAQLRAAGAEKVFREVASGAQTDRRQMRRDSGEAVREIAHSYNVHHSTISRLSIWSTNR